MYPEWRADDRQSKLFFASRPLGNHGHRRHVVGDLVERLTADLFQGRRFKCSGNFKYCPDVGARGLFFECKGAGRTNQTLIYKGRLEKDYDFNLRRPLLYAVWHHKAKTKDYDTVEALEAGVINNLRAMYVVHFADVWNLCGVLPIERFNSKYGYGHAETTTYGEGFRVAIKDLAKLACFTISFEDSWEPTASSQ